MRRLECFSVAIEDVRHVRVIILGAYWRAARAIPVACRVGHAHRRRVRHKSRCHVKEERFVLDLLASEEAGRAAVVLGGTEPHAAILHRHAVIPIAEPTIRVAVAERGVEARRIAAEQCAARQERAVGAMQRLLKLRRIHSVVRLVVHNFRRSSRLDRRVFIVRSLAAHCVGFVRGLHKRNALVH